jgi:glycosyltransferase involved in cell wall biosynthesis
MGFIFAIRKYYTIFEAHGWKEKEKIWIYKMMIKNIYRIITNSKGTKEIFIREGAEEKKVLAVPNGVDLEKFDLQLSKIETRKKVNLPVDKKIILYSGSFYIYDWKGVNILLETARKLSNDYLVVLVGGKKNEIEKIEKEGKPSNVLALEYKPIDLMPYYLKSADILVLPNKKGDNISEKYTSPIKLFEYMASRRPIIASDLPSIREIIDGATSILVEPDSPEALSKAIQRAIADGNKLDRMTENAFNKVLDYTWEKRAEKILSFIRISDQAY